jgi:MFS transporter, DHA3 family, macrolide efflux protein
MENSTAWKRPFFVFWTAQAFSQVGSGLASFALIWWMTESTGSATILAIAAMVGLLPGVLIGPLAGTLVDRLNRKTVMIISDAISALMAALLVVLFWMQVIEIWHIYAIIAVRALAGAFQFPAMQSSTSLMAPKEQLTRVAGLNQALQGVMMVATPAMGAMTLSLLPLHMIMGIDVVTAAIAIGLLFVVRIPQPKVDLKAVERTVMQDMRAGLAYVLRWRALLSIMGIAALLNLIITPAFSLIPILVTKHFQGGAAQLAGLNVAYGFGFIGGGVLLGVWGGFKRRILTSMLGLAGLGIGMLFIGISPAGAYGMALGGMVVVGVMNPLTNGPFFAILQSVVPFEMQGRVFTVMMSISMGMSPIGLIIAGPLADHFNVQIWYVLGAVVCLTMVAWVLLSPALLRLEDEGSRRVPVAAD